MTSNSLSVNLGERYNDANLTNVNFGEKFNDKNLTDIYTWWHEEGKDESNPESNLGEDGKRKFRVLMEFIKENPNGTLDEYKKYYFKNYKEISNEISEGGAKRKSLRHKRRNTKKNTRRNRRKSVRRRR